ncbi:hypothetical protein KQI63_09590 [bacterium]|nr:hypothetical protein [bacterium]
MARMVIKADGREVVGWESLLVRHAVGDIAGSFQAVFPVHTELMAGIRSALITIEASGSVVLRGYMDVLQPSRGSQGRRLMITGRSRTGDLVDCTADPKQYRDIRLVDLVSALCDPFEIDVVLDSGVDQGAVLGEFTLQAAETAWEALERACRRRMVMPFYDEEGDRILLTKPGASGRAAGLQEGVNLSSLGLVVDNRNRYSDYRIVGYTVNDDGEAVPHEGRARDAGCPRNRPKTLIVSGYSEQYLTERAAWEATVRAARAVGVSVTLPGNQQPDGTVWPLNGEAPLNAPSLGIQSALLIAERTLQVTEDRGTVTSLTLRRKDMFLFQPEVDEVDTDLAMGDW